MMMAITGSEIKRLSGLSGKLCPTPVTSCEEEIPATKPMPRKASR
jgi:hypothetical protein